LVAGTILGAAPAKAAQTPASPQSAFEYREAQVFLAKKEWADAVISLRKVLRDDPEFSPAAVDLSKALVYSGRREEALSVLSQAANRERGTRRAELIRRAQVSSRTFLTSTTFQLYQEGLSLMIARKYRAAQERLEKGLLQEPDNVELLTRLGQSLVLESDPDSAAERLRLAKKLNPYEPQIRLWLGRALHQRGELGGAIEELKVAYAELGGSELAPVWLADAMTSGSQRLAAIKILEKNTREQPFHLSGLLMLAKLKLMGTNSSDGLWSVRKDLQITLSRLEEAGKLPCFEGDLGLDLRAPEALKAEVEALLKKVDTRIEDRKPGPISAG
jgi:tetratricopeptide (TPR) repeat protein